VKERKYFTSHKKSGDGVPTMGRKDEGIEDLRERDDDSVR